MTDTLDASKALNEIAQPLGYAVTMSAGGTLGNDAAPDHRRFTIHRMDKPVASGPSFPSAEAVKEQLEQIAALPLWRLDLCDPSVEFDPADLSIKDVATGETFSLRGWIYGVTGKANVSGAAGGYEGATHLSVQTDDPPTIGKWYKSDTA
ncbi:hypothetical protein [Mycolicibacterium sp. J2]|uniref:hypothetical protein n=1 Tax=Mycolicibacterium sp. J2 TaxID=2993511 RepID=UPI00224B9BD6|nr:hypothetical protein [Mycolicibacterium sp. J2]MCX2710795.1 hypothetical protein [Mycolicibacterium sp. J2]